MAAVILMAGLQRGAIDIGEKFFRMEFCETNGETDRAGCRSLSDVRETRRLHNDGVVLPDVMRAGSTLFVHYPRTIRSTIKKDRRDACLFYERCNYFAAASAGAAGVSALALLCFALTCFAFL